MKNEKMASFTNDLSKVWNVSKVAICLLNVFFIVAALPDSVQADEYDKSGDGIQSFQFIFDNSSRMQDQLDRQSNHTQELRKRNDRANQKINETQKRIQDAMQELEKNVNENDKSDNKLNEETKKALEDLEKFMDLNNTFS